MWNDLVIGTGDKGNSAIHLFAIKGEHSISENRVSYWISGSTLLLNLDIGMVIFKDTEEGKQLGQMIENKEGLDKIRDFLEGIVLKNLSLFELKKAIKRAIEKSFQEGKRLKRSAKL